jgi:hypothetical protein
MAVQDTLLARLATTALAQHVAQALRHRIEGDFRAIESATP